MAQVIDAHPEAFNAMVFGTHLHPNTMQFLQNAPMIQSSYLTEAGQGFMQYSQQLLNQVMDSNVARIAVAVMRKMENTWCDDVIRELSTISQLQHAPSTMLRWVMANPMVREMHQRQEISGYEGRWYEPTPDESGREHFEWRCVNDGVLEERIVDGEETFGYTHYLDDRTTEDSLSLPSKDCITATWESIEHYLRFGNSDVTSEWNASL